MQCLLGVTTGGGLYHALVRTLRHTPVGQAEAVERQKAVRTQRAHNARRRGDARLVRRFQHHIGAPGGEQCFHARQGGDGCRVILREPDRRLHIQIVQSVIVEVTVCRFEHIRRGGVQSCQKAGAERHDCHNGQKAVETGADAPQNIYASCSFSSF